MDPKQVLIEADQCVSNWDTAGAVEHLNAYYQWRLRGGFQPYMDPAHFGAFQVKGDTFADQIATRLCDSLDRRTVQVAEVPHIEGKDVS